MGEDFVYFICGDRSLFFQCIRQYYRFFFQVLIFTKWYRFFWEVHDRVPNVFQVSAQFAQSHTTSLQNDFSYFPLE